ncbi:MAG: S8 family serine peptidase, partial [bacterium]
MRTALLFGVAGGLLLSGCSAPSGTPTNLQQLPGRSPQLAIPAAQPTSTLAQKVTAVADLTTAGLVRTDHVIIKFKASAKPAEQSAVISRFDLTLLRSFPELGYGVYTLPETQPLASVLQALWADPTVAVAEPDYIHKACALEVRPLDPKFGEQTNLLQINMPQAWFVHPGDPRDATIGPTIPDVSDVTVAVLDTGFDFTHPDLNLNPDGNPAGDLVKVYGGIDIVNGDSNAKDDNGHGTLVAGIIGALTDN